MRDQFSQSGEMAAASATCTALLTGFGPFPGVPHNVSGVLVHQIGARIRKRFPTSRIVTEALPTEWEFAPERVADLICNLRPSIAIHFGVSDQAHGFVIETLAQNQTGRLDAAGYLPSESEIEPFGPRTLASQLPTGRLCSRLNRLGLPNRLSRDAGTYLCNAVFYRSVLTQTELGTGGRSGFVHLPVAVGGGPNDRRRYRSPAPVIDFEMAVRGGVEIVSSCLGA